MSKGRESLGLPPGTPVYTGDKKDEMVRIMVMDYNEEKLDESVLVKLEDGIPFAKEDTVTWVNIDGVHNVRVIEEFGRTFNLHPLIVEDLVNIGQRPKVEIYGNYLFLVLKMLYFDQDERNIKSEQVSLVLGEHYVISFQEVEGDVFNSIRERIRGSAGRIRRMGADYLAYAIFDAVVDNYFIILEKLSDRIEDLEEELVAQPEKSTLQDIHALKRLVITLRKSVWPLREVINNFQKAIPPLLKEETSIYLRDVYDHTIQVIDTIETFREMLSGMLDIYLSTLSNKMNEVMKVLTIIATIFIPLTFIAGIYGMNFERGPDKPLSMPELGWYWGYPAVWVLMIIITIGMILYFKKKDWL